MRLFVGLDETNFESEKAFYQVLRNNRFVAEEGNGAIFKHRRAAHVCYVGTEERNDERDRRVTCGERTGSNTCLIFQVKVCGAGE